MRLASSQLSSLWLIVFRNFFEGVALSKRASLLPLSKDFHPVFQRAFKALWWALLIAAGLIGKGFLTRGGRRCFSDECPSAAAHLASLSASSFPAMPLCPAVHHITSLSLRLPSFFILRLAVRIISLAMW